MTLLIYLAGYFVAFPVLSFMFLKKATHCGSARCTLSFFDVFDSTIHAMYFAVVWPLLVMATLAALIGYGGAMLLDKVVKK